MDNGGANFSTQVRSSPVPLDHLTSFACRLYLFNSMYPSIHPCRLECRFP